ncbi:toll/interleukin-1 receptor domain-containing protein [Rubrivivax gelatinosus]|uniref:toll/interleukin-1 receptor domain-containing protein n=1 Tax=Rubrivivax gelatinosus TaxID=28068 RepID=UPI0010521186|nr:toll/interleukin-1 receptor domain-containing protein [Rubrivivax gelatinosus]MBK1688800.1 hypothetical protein [Rubrivivax gelatinosus]
MNINQATLRSAGSSIVPQRHSAPIQRTAFLCHSHHDRSLALGLQTVLKQHGMELYIDWQDSTMPDKPSAETAKRLRARIQECYWFLFLATQQSMMSRWCPWELGHADGTKLNERILVVPTNDDRGSYGSEYIDLYRRVEFANDGRLAAFYPRQSSGQYVNSL